LQGLKQVAPLDLQVLQRKKTQLLVLCRTPVLHMKLSLVLHKILLVLHKTPRLLLVQHMTLPALHRTLVQMRPLWVPQ